MVEKLVWLPTWHQARLVCRQLSIADEAIAGRWQSSHDLFPEKDPMHIYGLIVEALQHGEPSA